MFIGVGHVVLTLVLFADELVDIGDAGVVVAVSFDERASQAAAALWFAVNGAFLAILGGLARAYEQQVGALPKPPGAALLAVGVAGALIAPVSGFYAYIALGALWLHEARTWSKTARAARIQQRWDYDEGPGTAGAGLMPYWRRITSGRGAAW